VDRDLSSNERELLEWLLADPNVPCADTLRAQIPFTRAVEGVPNMPTWLHLGVFGGDPADCPDGNVADAVVYSPSGQPTGFLFLWTANGYLESVEHPWFTDDMPLEFPTPDRLRREPLRADPSARPRH
jgi:hypothetical protein